jgi:hypothetical protein
MDYETSTDPVAIVSDNGEALVPGTEANATGKPVTIRHPVTGKVLETVKGG